MSALRRLVLGSALVCNGFAPATAAPGLKPATSGLHSAEVCATCHRDIAAAWKLSAHAHSLEDPLFQDALRELKEEGTDARVCLSCHAPTAQITRDFALEKKITWEGVTCDYCHSVASITPGPIPRLEVRPGTVKYGPIRDALSSAHGTEFREHFVSSSMCAGCHEYVSPSGVGVLTTYSDWKASPQAAAGQTCQSCHMSEVRANVVDPRVARAKSDAVNLHTMPGGHSIDQMNRAVKIQSKVRREPARVMLDAEIANRGAGHAVPTGSAARQLVLEIRMDTSRGQSAHETRIYERVLTDAAGTPLVRDRDLFSRAVTLKSDSRLRAGETRTEHFVFEVDPTALVNLKLEFSYRHTPEPGHEPPVRQVFYTQSWTLPAVP